MRRLFWSLLAMIGLILITLQAGAQDKNWGIGLRLGDPTGVTAKKYLGASNALELALGGNFNGSGLEFMLHYLFHYPVRRAHGLEWYYGFGAQIDDDQRNNRDLKRDHNAKFGADGVLGLEYTFEGGKFSTFLEGILFVELVDDPFELDLDAGIGVRFNF